MASSAPLKDIDEQFLQCCLCMEQLKEPKMLPCLHHYCRDCLKEVFKDAKEIECPTCREKHTLPEGGIDKLKTDFNTKNIIEFIQLQSSVKVDPLRTCIHCRKTLEASAFCFKCNDFLCQECHEFHASSLMVKDHHPHIFSLSEAEARNLTIQKLSSLREAPQCHTHPGKLSELCCSTCGNLPICVPCSYGTHRGHQLEEVTLLARSERERLTGRVTDLMRYEGKIQKMQKQVEESREKLRNTVEEEKQALQEELDAEEEDIKREIKDIDEELKKRQAKLENKLKEKTSTRKNELEAEMREAREKYERVCKEDREEADAELERLQREAKREREQIQDGLDGMTNSIKELLASLKIQEEEKTKQIGELADTIRRFETVTTTASSILNAKHDWTDIQCIPDICRAIEPLVGELKKDHPELQNLAGMTVKTVPSLIRGKLVVDIEGLKAGWRTDDITSIGDGSLIITGKATDKRSHITVVRTNGEKLQQNLLLSECDSPQRSCATLSQSKVASVCRPNEVGIYDIQNGTYQKVHLPGFNYSGYVTSVAVDPTNNNIIVSGRDNTNLYVYNNQLEYSHSITLPEGITYTWGITPHEGNLLVCDNVNGRAYALSMERSDCKLKYEFPKPVDVGDWRPRGVCTDRNGSIYVVWRRMAKSTSILAKYSPDGSQLLTTRLLGAQCYAICITTVDTEGGERLAMATTTTGKLILFSLE